MHGTCKREPGQDLANGIVDLGAQLCCQTLNQMRLTFKVRDSVGDGLEAGPLRSDLPRQGTEPRGVVFAWNCRLCADAAAGVAAAARNGQRRRRTVCTPPGTP